MKLTKLYSNKDSCFFPIEFNAGFNVVLGEIRLPENKDKDTHNLGKSKLAEIIDFCFLKQRSASQFLFKHIDIFKEFVFFLEVELNNGQLITIKRAVSSNTKIYIKKHSSKLQDFTGLIEGEWDYQKVSIDKATDLLDALFSLKAVSPWSYRNTINYALRSQGDFKDVFKLSNYIGKHLFWKPYVGKNLGFDAENLKAGYELQYEIEKQRDYLSELLVEVGDFQGDQEEILRGLLAIKLDDSSKIKNQLETFDFGDSDSETIKKLCLELNEEISELNKMKYYLSSNLAKLRVTSDNEKVEFNLRSTKKLFEEAGILFNEQVIASYSELLDFNRKITIERQSFVKQQVIDLKLEIDEVSLRLNELNETKSKNLNYLNSIDTFDKYKELTTHLVIVNTEINSIERKLGLSEKIDEKEALIRKKEIERSKVVEKIRVDRDSITKDEDSKYNEIKNYFIKFTKQVLDKNGLISTKQNGEGNLEFNAGIMDDKGQYTSEADGHSYKKILCIGYDLAMIQAYSSSDFVRFMYHDGALETLDDRKKYKFIDHVRGITETTNTQYILTVIDSDIPAGVTFDEKEIVITLHDDGDQGRLFKMPSW